MGRSKFLKIVAVLILGKRAADQSKEKISVLEPQKFGKQIVGRAEYAGILCRRVLYGLGGIEAGLVAVACAIVALLGYKYIMIDHRLPGQWIGAVFMCVSACCFLYILTVNWLQQAAKDVGAVLTTDRSVASLPACDSLVRASEEPVQVQEAVLLRASTAGQEKHEEQLLRAAAEEQE